MAANFKEQSKKHFDLNGQSYTYYDLKAVEEQGITKSFQFTLFNSCFVRIFTSSRR